MALLTSIPKARAFKAGTLSFALFALFAFAILISDIGVFKASESSRGPASLSSLHQFLFSATTLDPPVDSVPRTSLEKYLSIDPWVARNSRANLQGATASTVWSESSRRGLTEGGIANLTLFVAQPLMATVDRRPIIVRKQTSYPPPFNFHSSGSKIGCALSTNTALTELGGISLKQLEQNLRHATCAVCFQFSSKGLAKQFVASEGGAVEPDESTRCFYGEPRVSYTFANWQQDYQQAARGSLFGYPWTVDCELPNGHKELTCDGISEINDSHDELQRIYVKTNFTLAMKSTHKDRDMKQSSIPFPTFHVLSTFPWDAVRSHSDDRLAIYKALPKNASDPSPYVPSSAKELKLAYFQGPNYDAEFAGAKMYLRSPSLEPESNGGVNPRFMSTLINLLRQGSDVTFFIGVLDGQAEHTRSILASKLELLVSDIYPLHARHLVRAFEFLSVEGNSGEYIPTGAFRDDIGRGSGAEARERDSSPHLNETLTLLDFMRLRNTKITIIPLPTPSLAFQTLLCGGQYGYASYILARFAADFHVVQYFDGDATPLNVPAVRHSLHERPAL